LGTGSGMSQEPSPLPPYTSRTWWLSDGRLVLRFRPVRWDFYSQRPEIISGELLPGEPIPLLQAQPSAQRKQRLELSRKEAVKLWGERRKQGWRPCPPQW
jgi:hypothetical protein